VLADDLQIHVKGLGNMMENFCQDSQYPAIDLNTNEKEMFLLESIHIFGDEGTKIYVSRIVKLR
jgi:hypothetical protein